MKNKGFTLTEILAVLVVISLLLLLVIPTITNGIRNKEGEVDETQKEVLYQAASEYIDNNKDTYPTKNGNSYCISISRLQEEGLVNEDLKSATENVDFSSKSIQATVNGKATKYELVDTENCIGATADSIGISISPSNDTWSQYKTVTITYPEVDDASFEYSFDEENWSTYNGPITVGLKENIDYNIHRDNDNVIIPAKIYARVVYSGETKYNKNSAIGNIDITAPTCSLKLNGTLNSTGQWYESNEVKVNMTAADTESGVSKKGINSKQDSMKNLKDEIIRKNDGDAITYYCHVVDKAGNYGTNSITFSKHSVAPTCSIKCSGTLGNDGWYKSDVTCKLNTDASGGSSISSYGITTSAAPTYNNTTTQTLKTDTNGTTYYGYVKNSVGQSGKCSTTIKRDATPPTITNVKNSSNGNATKESVTVSATIKDVTSGISTATYSFNGNSGLSNWTNASNGTYTITISNSSKVNSTFTFYAQDKAGNKSQQSGGTVNINKSKPTCSITCSGTKGKNNWYTSNVTCSLNTSSNGGGSITGKGITTSSTTTYNNTTTQTLKTDTKGITYYGYVKSSSGEEGKCSTTIKRDTTPPKLKKKGNASDGSVSGTSFTDATSGVSATYYRFKRKGDDYNWSSWSTSKKDPKKGNRICTVTIKVQAKAVDKAGNESKEDIDTFTYSSGCNIYACNKAGYGYNCIHSKINSYKSCTFNEKYNTKLKVKSIVNNGDQYSLSKEYTYKNKKYTGYIWKKCTATTKGTKCSNCPG